MRTTIPLLLAALAAMPTTVSGQPDSRVLSETPAEKSAQLDASRLTADDLDTMTERELELALESVKGAFGLSSQDFWVTAPEFYPWSGDDWIWNGLDYFYTPTGAGSRRFEARLDLPAGAVVTGMQCFFNDTDTNDNGTVQLTRHEYDFDTDTPDATLIASVSSADSAGYQRPFEAFEETIRYRDEGLANFYTLTAVMPGSNVFVQFRGCRLLWHREISPAPGTATFDDVPVSHPFFQHIEALVASGITSGCGGGDYCPNNPLTRGQMAAFLARALGLHWPY